MALPRGDLHRLLQHGTQVHPRRPVGGIVRQGKFMAESLIQDFQFDLLHSGIP
jgi:hypothetical protein